MQDASLRSENVFSKTPWRRQPRTTGAVHRDRIARPSTLPRGGCPARWALRGTEGHPSPERGDGERQPPPGSSATDTLGEGNHPTRWYSTAVSPVRRHAGDECPHRGCLQSPEITGSCNRPSEIIRPLAAAVPLASTRVLADLPVTGQCRRSSPPEGEEREAMLASPWTTRQFRLRRPSQAAHGR